MAPRIVGEFVGGMARGSHICHENYEFTDVKGLVPTPVFSHGLDLRLTFLVCKPSSLV